MYQTGNGVAKDMNEAARLYRLAIDQGITDAMVNLGAVFIQGDGLPPDLAEGIRLYIRASEQESSEAQMRLGNMYENGLGFRQDATEAVRWYSLAIEQGNPNAQFCLGLMLFQGRGVTKDAQKATELIQLAADVGHPHAAAFLHRIRSCPHLLFLLPFFCSSTCICLNSSMHTENPVTMNAAAAVLDENFEARESKEPAQEGPLDRLFGCCRMRA